MKKEARQEIRRALLGRTEPAEDGRLVVLEKGQVSNLVYGVSDGAGAVRILGVRKKAKRLTVSCPEARAREIAYKLMGEIGRVLYLNELPKAPACLIRYVITRPAVLIFDYEDGVPILSAWSGRGLTGWISNRRALSAFIRRMPGKLMSVSEQEVPKDKDVEREKAEKQAKKEAKKARKAAKKQKEKKNSGAAGAESSTEEKA